MSQVFSDAAVQDPETAEEAALLPFGKQLTQVFPEVLEVFFQLSEKLHTVSIDPAGLEPIEKSQKLEVSPAKPAE